ncbi:hypothetical protein EVA_08611 [gut metagenome]|uniref:Uncharacterized protein n=1 Tax=gut metagenome TaxID=749906 RepID=J9G7Q7_9ZZZZ
MFSGGRKLCPFALPNDTFANGLDFFPTIDCSPAILYSTPQYTLKIKKRLHPEGCRRLYENIY